MVSDNILQQYPHKDATTETWFWSIHQLNQSDFQKLDFKEKNDYAMEYNRRIEMYTKRWHELHPFDPHNWNHMPE